MSNLRRGRNHAVEAPWRPAAATRRRDPPPRPAIVPRAPPRYDSRRGRRRHSRWRANWRERDGRRCRS